MTFHGAALVAAIGFWNKFGDRTELADKSLRSTKDALDALLAYLGSTLAERIRPTIERILANATQATGTIKEFKAEEIADEFNGEAFRSEVSSFVNAGISELLTYRTLVYARDRWAVWAKRISTGVLVLLIVEGIATFGFFTCKVIAYPVTKYILLSSMALTFTVSAFCIVCMIAKHHYDGSIAEFRDKIL